MIKAYIFENNYLIERLILENPLPSVFLMKRKSLSIASFNVEISEPQSVIEKTEYKYLFRSPANEVLIYSNTDALSFVENGLHRDIMDNKQQFKWKIYKTPVVMPFERREVIEKIIKSYFGDIRENDTKCDSVIAETCAKKIEAYLVNDF